MPQACARCQATTRQPVIVAIEHGASVGGRTVYACPGKCADSFPKQCGPFDGGLPTRYVPISQRR
ncbi:hypothetical protein GCM10009574_060880 [Streptomyces asiaticus]|uniref:TRASH domain-containing protein n=2 Tax=Streptomyces rhizosphaericus TaxID=114699 RepID=A0ABN1PYH1_9ACTN